jgi:hypothetical protein
MNVYSKKEKGSHTYIRRTHTPSHSCDSTNPDSRNLDSRIPDSRNGRAGMQERKEKRKQTMNPCIRETKRERERETIAMTLVIANASPLCTKKSHPWRIMAPLHAKVAVQDADLVQNHDHEGGKGVE